MKLIRLGLSVEALERVRSRTPKLRILEAARLALAVDDEPNSDLIEYIAGYAPRSAIYHHFSSMAELLEAVGIARVRTPLPPVPLAAGHLDLASIIPEKLLGVMVHLDDVEKGDRFLVWQKVNGGTREVALNRSVRRVPFLAGLVLYAGEGTKSLKSGRVEVANSSPALLRLHTTFMNGLGFKKSALRARVQIHSRAEESEGVKLWATQLGLSPTQFVKPMLSASSTLEARRTFTLQLSYANTMLLILLRYWTERVDRLVRDFDP